MATKTKNTKRTKKTATRAPKTAEKPAAEGRTIGEYMAERGMMPKDATRLAADGKRYAVDPANPLRFKDEPLPEGLVERAAERAGVKPTIPYMTPEVQAKMDADDRARDEIVASIGPNLRHASDLLGEVLAELVNYHGGMERNVAEINALLWRVRWELGLPGAAVRGGHGADEGDETEGTNQAVAS